MSIFGERGFYFMPSADVFPVATQKNWYAIYCRSRHARMVHERLLAKGVVASLAEYEVRVKWGARVRKTRNRKAGTQMLFWTRVVSDLDEFKICANGNIRLPIRSRFSGFERCHASKQSLRVLVIESALEYNFTQNRPRPLQVICF